MKKRFTKALALLLSAMLIIGLAPTAFAADSEETLDSSGVKIVYDMYTDYVEDNGMINVVEYDHTNGFWRFEDSNFTFGDSRWVKETQSRGMEAAIVVSEWWAIRIYVPKSGKYELTMKHGTYSSGGVSGIYFGSADKGATNILKENAIGSVCFYSSPEVSAFDEKVGEVNVPTAGEYIVVFRSEAAGNGAGTGTGRRQIFKQVILDGCGDGEVVPAVMGTVNVGGSNRIKAKQAGTVSVETFDGITAEQKEVSDNVTYTSSDDTILSVSENTATAHRAGTVTLTASSESWANDVASTIIVDPEMDYSDIKIVYSTEVSSVDANATMENVNYADTSGFWEFAGKHAGATIKRNHANHGLNALNAAGHWWAMKIYIPKPGAYELKLNHSSGRACGINSIYFGDSSKTPQQLMEENPIKTCDFYSDQAVTAGYETPISIVEIPKTGEYTIVFKTEGRNEKATSAYLYLKQVILDGCTGTEKNYVPMLNVVAESDVITAENSTKVSATSALMSDATAVVTNPVITYATEDTDIVNVNSSTGEVTGLSDGVATVTATVTANGASSSRSVNITVNNKEISDGFNAKTEVAKNYITPSVAGITEDGVITAKPNSDGSYNLTAPDTKDGSEFLYWAMGMGTNKRIVSFDAILKNYVPEGNNVNYLVPVYASDVAVDVEEYYNINGQRIAAVQVGAEKPALPSIPGIGEAKEWKQCAENVYVAEYESTVYNKVTVNGEEVDYGTKIECKPGANAGTFRFWKKSVNGKEEVVSLEPEYTFYAWENTTVTAEYGDDAPTFTGKKLKIIIDSFDVNGETGVMAEFIGISNAVEKGIMFTDATSSETRKMAMTTKDKQFTVIANMAGTYIGYAIVGDEVNGYTLITDGEYIKQ